MKPELLTNVQNQTGQTLVETLVAALVLSIGIGAAVSLAVYGLGATTSVTKQIIAVGLAREGLEAVRNMRDTNWLRGTLWTNCYNHADGTSTAACYTDWLTNTYNINPPSGKDSYYLGFNSAASGTAYWQLVQSQTLYGLNYSPNGSTGGFYTPGVAVASSNSGFARRVTIAAESADPPFNKTTGPRLRVTVDVWWKDKRCPNFTTNPATSASCRVTLETYLTNWKDYE